MTAEPAAGPPTRPAERRRRFAVRGRVQGVGFRAWTQKRARELGLRGTVRNRPDGDVEVEAAGPEPALERLLQLLRQGPLWAAVSEVRELPPADSTLPPDFRITF
jgi:acylphosphatase